VQFAKALSPIDVSKGGITISARLEHSENEYLSMLIRLAGSVKEVMPKLPKKE
jgi:hypothetical protein